MALLQAAQTSVSKKDVAKSNTKDSFENVMRQEADQASQADQSDQTQTSKGDQPVKTQDKAQNPQEGSTKEETVQSEVVQDVAAQLANTDILAAILFNRNDVDAAIQALQQDQTSVQMTATTQTAAVQPVVQENVMQQTTEGTRQMTQALPQQTVQQTVAQAQPETAKQNTKGAVATQPQTVVATNEQTAQVQQPVQEAVQQDNTHQSTQSPIQKDVVVEKAEEQPQTDAEDMSMLLQTKQQTAEGDVIHVKVGDVVSVNKGNVPEQLADKILMRTNNEFELQLEPESLGKVQIKVAFADGETHVSILCASQKAMDTLMDNRNGLVSVLENRTGQNVTVQVQVQEDKDLFQQQNQDQQQQQDQSRQEQKKNQQPQEDQTMDFLQQLRLGLV